MAYCEHQEMRRCFTFSARARAYYSMMCLRSRLPQAKRQFLSAPWPDSTSLSVFRTRSLANLMFTARRAAAGVHGDRLHEVEAQPPKSVHKVCSVHSLSWSPLAGPWAEG